MNVLIEMTMLSLGMPCDDASSETRAAWYRAKAALHEHLAAAGGDDRERERALVAKALEKSVQLLRMAESPATPSQRCGTASSSC